MEKFSLRPDPVLLDKRDRFFSEIFLREDS